MKLAEEWTDIKGEETGSMSPQRELPEILEDVKDFLSRYILFSKEAHAIVVTLWGAHTWVIGGVQLYPLPPDLISGQTMRQKPGF